MSLRKAVLLLAAAVTAIAAMPAQAQLAAYGTFSVNQLSNIRSTPQPNPNNDGSLRDSVNPLGGTLGVYYDFLKLGHVTLGVDGRGTITRTKQGAYTDYDGGGARLYSALGGIRAVFHTPIPQLRPYLQGSAGLGRSDYGLLYNGAGITNTPSSTLGNEVVLHNNFQYEAFGGLDITLLPYMDFRLVEFGYGGINPFGTYSHNYPVKSVSTGLVFHLPF